MRWSNSKMMASAVAVLGLGGVNAQAAIMGDEIARYGFAGSRVSAVDGVLGVGVSIATMLDEAARNNLKYLTAGNPGESIGRWTSRSGGTPGTIAQAIAGDDGLELTLTPTSLPVTFTGVSFDLVFENLPEVAHTTTWALYASFDNFVTPPSDANKLGEWTLTETGTSATNDHWISSEEVAFNFASTTAPLSLRLYMASTLVTSGNMMGVDNLVVYAVPEPASLALLGLGAAVMLGRRRG